MTSTLLTGGGDLLGGSPSGTSVAPTIVHLDPCAGVSANTNFSTFAQDNVCYKAQKRQSSGAQNAEFTFYPFACAAGTYRLDWFGLVSTDRGIFTVYVDAVSVGTVDSYAAGPATSILSLTGVALTAGEHTMRLVMATKNASASNYYGIVSWLTLTRTGA